MVGFLVIPALKPSLHDSLPVPTGASVLLIKDHKRSYVIRILRAQVRQSFKKRLYRLLYPQ